MTQKYNNNQKYIGFIKQIIRFSKLVFTPLAILFLIIIAWQNHTTIIQTYSLAKKDILITAIVGWSLLYLLYPIMLVTLIKHWGTPLLFKHALHIFINRLPARYLPGGIWQTVARFSDFRQYGLNNRQLTGLLLLENFLALGLALLIGGLILIQFQNAGVWWAIAFTGTMGGIIIILGSLILINRYVLPKEHRIDVSTYIRVLIIMSIYWILAASVFVLYVYSLPNISSDQQAIRLGGVYLFSWSIGNIAFFAPQGIGVFEVVSSKLLQGNFGLKETIALLAGFRVIIILADLLAWTCLKGISFLRQLFK